MNGMETTPVLIARAAERLRQERETFDQHQRHDEWWFRLRLVMGFSAVVLLFFIMVVSTYILVNAASFASSVVTAAGAGLFVDALGLLIGVWKITLNPSFLTRLAPITDVNMEASLEERQKNTDAPGDSDHDVDTRA